MNSQTYGGLSITGLGGMCEGNSIDSALDYALEWPILEADAYSDEYLGQEILKAT